MMMKIRSTRPVRKNAFRGPAIVGGSQRPVAGETPSSRTVDPGRRRAGGVRWRPELEAYCWVVEDDE